MTSESLYKEWQNALQETINEISISNNKPLNDSNIINMNIDFVVKKMIMNLRNEDNEPWAIGYWEDFTSNTKSIKEGIETKILCKNITVQYPEHPLCSDVIKFEGEENDLECTVLLKHLTNVNANQFNVKGRLNPMKVVFAPVFIKKLAKYTLGMGKPPLHSVIEYPDLSEFLFKSIRR